MPVMPSTLFPHLISFNEHEIGHYISDLTHQILEKYHPLLSDFVFLGLNLHSQCIAARVAKSIIQKHAIQIPVGLIDPSLYLPKSSSDSFISFHHSSIPCSIHQKKVIIFQEILFTGTHCLAALHALADVDSPCSIEIACLLDRGHRKFPVFPTFCSQNIETSISDRLQLKLVEIDGEDSLTTIPKDSYETS